MATLEQKIAAERDALALLEQYGLPEPDDVEYGCTCIRLIWWEPKAALIIQIDPAPPGWVFGEDLRDLDDLRNIQDITGEEDHDGQDDEDRVGNVLVDVPEIHIDP
jgi:hypothetical protein